MDVDNNVPKTPTDTSHAAQAAAFADDPRIYFNKETSTWRFEQDDGSEMEYDATKSAWVPMLDEEVLKTHSQAYSIVGVDENVPAAPVLARELRKRKEPEDYTSATPPEGGPSLKKGKGKNGGKEDKPRSKNTAVYVTKLPLDATDDEIYDCFSKYGLIEEDDQGEPKIKMYAKDDGSFSGEALVVYFKEDSVTLAESLLDEAELRLGDPSSRMIVKKADFTHKGGPSGGSSGTNGAPRRVVDKKKATRRIGKMQRKLEEWGYDDGFGPSTTPEDNIRAVNKNSRVVVLKRMFTVRGLEEDPTLLLDLKEDVREECESLGQVTNVVLYDKEDEGVMTVKFREPLSAQACVLKMNGRFFDGRRIEASLYTGRERFQRSGAHDDIEGDNDEAEKKRLDEFSKWLMTEGD